MVPETAFNTTKLKTCLETSTGCNNSVMFKTIFFNCTKNHVAYTQTYRT